MKSKISEALSSIYIAVICFLTYACVYAFRKPFTIGLYRDHAAIFGVEYKNILVIAQVLGYTISKFYGIKYVSELKRVGRGWSILILIGFSWIPLLIFPFVHTGWSVIFLFLNGLPLGILWGLIFSYIEGRKSSDFMGSINAISFIVASGFVKSVAKWLQIYYSIDENWIPFFTGFVFILPVIVLVFLLEKVPEPNKEDIEYKSERVPLDATSRKKFFSMFSFGLISFIIIYLLLTLFRDIRDNFAADIWLELGYGNNVSIFTSTELPIALFVLFIISSIVYIKNNKLAFQLAQFIILSGFIICGIASGLFMTHMISGYLWIILVGLGLYMGYIPFNAILFDRMIATFKIKGNVGYFMYLVDSFGYLASVFVIFLKGVVGVSISWTLFYQNGVLVLSIVGSIISLITIFYFNKKYKFYIDE